MTVQAGSMGGKVHWIDADADASEVLRTMEEQHIKRLPVIDVKGGHRLVGMITDANLAKNLSDAKIAEFVSRVADVPVRATAGRHRGRPFVRWATAAGGGPTR